MPQISVTASSLVARALSLADLVNSTFISYDDKLNSMNEAWKDVYNFLTERNDDYFMTLTTLVMTQAVPNAPLNTNEWLIALPTDFFKLRILDYSFSGTWIPMMKFALDRRNNYNTIMQYRFQGQNLWIVGGPFTASQPQIRLGYYPPPNALYFPNTTQFFTLASSLTDAQLAVVIDPFYIPGNIQSSLPQTTSQSTLGVNGMLYSLPGTGIDFVSNNSNVNTNIVATATATSLPKYYKGYVYWLQAGDVFGAAFNPLAPAILTGTNLTSVANITWFDIGVVANTAYFVNGTNVKSAAVSGITVWSGTNITTPLTPPGTAISYGLVQGIQFWVTSVGALVVNGTSLVTGVIRATSNSTYLFYQVGSVLYRGTVSTPSVVPTIVSEILQSDIKSFNGNDSNGYIGAIQSEGLNIIGVSDTPDYVIQYPNNLAPEMVAYQMAMDFARKQDNVEHLKDLMERYQSIEDRFINDVIMRDDYKPERINPTGSGKANLPGLPGGF